MIRKGGFFGGATLFKMTLVKKTFVRRVHKNDVNSTFVTIIFLLEI
jgi:hypothetical protein